MSIGDAEIKTQERVIRFFKDPEILGYQYIGNLSDYQNKNIKEDRLRQYLRLKGYADKLIDAAVMQLQQEAAVFSGKINSEIICLLQQFFHIQVIRIKDSGQYSLPGIGKALFLHQSLTHYLRQINQMKTDRKFK